MSEPRVTIIVAVSENGVIGRDLDMPWKLSTDLKRFKAMTMGTVSYTHLTLPTICSV